MTELGVGDIHVSVGVHPDPGAAKQLPKHLHYLLLVYYFGRAIVAFLDVLVARIGEEVEVEMDPLEHLVGIEGL